MEISEPAAQIDLSRLPASLVGQATTRPKQPRTAATAAAPICTKCGQPKTKNAAGQYRCSPCARGPRGPQKRNRQPKAPAAEPEPETILPASIGDDDPPPIVIDIQEIEQESAEAELDGFGQFDNSGNGDDELDMVTRTLDDGIIVETREPAAYAVAPARDTRIPVGEAVPSRLPRNLGGRPRKTPTPPGTEVIRVDVAEETWSDPAFQKAVANGLDYPAIARANEFVIARHGKSFAPKRIEAVADADDIAAVMSKDGGVWYASAPAAAE